MLLTEPSECSRLLTAELIAYKKAGESRMMRWFQKYKSLYTFAALIVGGIIMHAINISFHEQWWPWLELTIHTFCDALIVAGILGVTVDRFLKEDLMRDVGSIFIGWALPDEIRNNIREVSQTSFVRRNYRAEYRFTIKNDKVTIDAIEEWDIFNYSSSTQTYKPHMAINLVEKPLREHMKYSFTDKDGKIKVLLHDELNSDTYCTEEKTRIVYRPRPCKLPYQDIEDRRTTAGCRVKWEYQITKNLEDFILSYSPTPTIGMTVIIKCDPGLHFEFEPNDANHSDDSDQWQYPTLFMPYKFILIRWCPKLPEAKLAAKQS